MNPRILFVDDEPQVIEASRTEIIWRLAKAGESRSIRDQYSDQQPSTRADTFVSA